jgi:pilus assembly protein CpaB
MFRLKPKSLITLALFSGLLAVFGFYAYVKGQKELAAKSTYPVVVVKTGLAIGDSLSEQNIDIMQWPMNLVMEGSFKNKSELVGRVVKIQLQSGEPVLETKLAPKGSMGGLLSQIPAGMRAMTVSVNVVSGVGGFVLPGARVDILATFNPGSNRAETTTATILQDVVVLAVDQTFKKANDEPITVKSVTLLVKPDQAERLTLASTEGKLQLILRNLGDSDSTSTKGAMISQLGSRPTPEKPKVAAAPVRRAPKIVQVTPPPPPVVAPKPEPVVEKAPEPKPKIVEVIRSNQRTQLQFDDSGQMVPDKKR